MEYGSMSIQRLQSGRWLNWGIRFFLTAALTASQTAGGYAPFALGCIAAAGPGADGAAALLGGVTGALLFLDFQQVLALAAVGILILTAATAFRDTAFLQKPWVLPVLAAGMVLAVDGIYVLQSLDPLSHAAPCAAASALTGVSAHFFTRLFQPEEDRLAPEGLLFLGAALTLALGDLTILNVSVGRVLLCALLAYTAYDQGPMTGVTAGLGLGLITDLSAGTSGLFTAAYGVAGLCAAKCRRRSSGHADLPGGVGPDASSGNGGRFPAVFSPAPADLRRKAASAGSGPGHRPAHGPENPSQPGSGGAPGAI